jgi:hypothetical protein
MFSKVHLRVGWTIEGTMSRDFNWEMGEGEEALGAMGRISSSDLVRGDSKAQEDGGTSEEDDRNFSNGDKGTTRDNKINKQGESNSLVFDRI